MHTRGFGHLPMNVVKELMGHSNIKTTQEFYLAVAPDHEVKAASGVQRLLEAADKDSGGQRVERSGEKMDVKRTYEPASERI
jgi:hypothetical protein